MSNHYSAANLRFPGDDARLDLTDLFVFASPDDPERTVLIIDVNPYTTGMSAMPPFLMKREFHPDGIYRINIDTNQDAQADAAFTFVFSELEDGKQAGTVRFATGSEARESEPAGEVLITGVPVGFDETAEPVVVGQVRLFIGVRSDPFFADADGSFHGFNWTGQDAFADRNVLSIALEVPNEMLSTDSAIGVWAAVDVRRDGAIVQVDRGGHPTINPFVNPNNIKNEYNLRQPVDDLANYLELWSGLLEQNGYSPEEASEAAQIVLPDILRIDRSRPTAYPNGRALTNDVFSARFAWMTKGRVGPDGLKPHDDMLPTFPFLGVPNRYPGVD
ncbi:DUF4331 family protein [Marmoricola sp. URHB0036]|uniref:DUF4331 family protein n=1 Tax=Marmoricola sp. URHB0036 TaxID=1298863 RepID=UPI0004880975|nr:DUF4331 family protein [Marmoricola sp. URHB0036]